MQDSIQKLIAEMQSDGPQKFSQWNAETFDSFIEGPLKDVIQRMEWKDKKTPDWNSTENFLRLIYEGVGLGILHHVEHDAPASNFLSFYISHYVPYQLTQLDRADRTEFLQLVWNIGEGMAKEPQWLNQFVIAKTDWSVEGHNLADHITKILEPVLSPPAPATWEGTPQLHQLELKRWLPGFLPGRMYLCSPNVLCIEDRINPPETLGVFLQKGKEPEILGSIGKLPEYVESFDQPSIRANPNSILVNQREVEAKWIQHPREPFCMQSGFVAVTADDSQKLWLVEAA